MFALTIKPDNGAKFNGNNNAYDPRPEQTEAIEAWLAMFSQHRIILAIADSIDWSKEESPELVFRYKTAIKVSDVLNYSAKQTKLEFLALSAVVSVIQILNNAV